MGSLQALKLLNNAVLFFMLINFIQLIDANASSRGDVEILKNSTVVANNSTKRERSTRVSSDQVKVIPSSHNEEIINTSRRISSNIKEGDLKFSTILYGRRGVPNRLKLPQKNQHIKNTNDEFLETEESVQGLYFIDANSNNNTTNNTNYQPAKENSNMINIFKEKSNEKKNIKERTVSANTPSVSTTKVNRRKYTRTSLMPTNQTRVTVFRGRIKYSPSSTLKEETEDPLLHTGQKLGRRHPDIFRKTTNTRKTTSYPSTTPRSKSKEEDLEIMEVSVAKQSSTEKNKLWKARNIVAINNYMRKLNPHLNVLSTISLSPENTTRVTTIYYTNHNEETSTESAIKHVPIKIIYRSPGLIINVPDDASPVFFNDNRNYQQSDGELERSVEQEEHLNSTAKSTDISKETTSLQSFSEVETNRATKKIYSTIPRQKIPSSSVIPDPISSTISTFLNNVSSKKNNIIITTLSTNPFTASENLSSTTAMHETTTWPYSTPENVMPPSMMPDTTTNRPFIIYEVISTTGKSQPNEVFVEVKETGMGPLYFAFAALGLLPFVVIAFLFVKRYIRRQEQKDDIENYGNDIQPISPVVTLDHSDDGTCSEGDESIITESDFNRNKLRFKSLLGEGNFGQVWKAEVDDLPGHAGTTKIAAVKTERVNNGQGGLKAECEIMRKLGSHSNVVTLLGACVEQEPHLLIMEYAMRGRLLSLLRTARNVINGLHHTPNRQPVMPLSPRRLTYFALDIARGMEYIAEKRIVHRDLAARNVLLDHNGVCKICDFGMSIDLNKTKTPQGQLKIPRVSTHHNNKFKFDMTARVFGGLKKVRNDDSDIKNRPALPIRWMSPEALKYHIYSVESDVFAYGILLWEIATLGITPYPTLTGREVIREVPNGLTPDIPANCKQELSDIMTKCWKKDSTQRPSFADIKKALSRTLLHWHEDNSANHAEYLDVSGFSEDYENGMIYFNRRVSEFECEI